MCVLAGLHDGEHLPLIRVYCLLLCVQGDKPFVQPLFRPVDADGKSLAATATPPSSSFSYKYCYMYMKLALM